MNKTTSILFIDMMSDKEHAKLNNFYINSLWIKNSKLAISKEVSKLYENFDQSHHSSKIFKGGFFNRFLLCFQTLKTCFMHKPKIAWFLSYDLLTFPIIALYLQLLGIKIYTFEHNTIPTTFSKKIFHKLFKTSVTRLALTPYTTNYYIRIGLNCKHIPLPCVRGKKNMLASLEELPEIKKRKDNFEWIALCPSGSINPNQLEQIAKRKPHILFAYKCKSPIKLPNIITYSYLSQYEEALLSFDFLYIPMEKHFKVSGPVYDAIALGKTVILKNNNFGRYIRSLFPSLVFFEDHDWTLKETHNHTDKIDSYNNRIHEMLKDLVSE